MSVNLALIRFIYPHNTIGKGIALNGLVIGLGVASGPSIGSLVLEFASWQWIFWVNLPVGLLALVLGCFTLPPTPLSERPLNLKAIVLSIAATTLTVIGIDSLVHGGRAGAGLLTLLGFICGVSLIRLEKNARTRVVPTDLLPIPDIFLAFCVSGLAYVATNLYIIGLPFTLETVFHRAPTVTGFLITPWALSVGITSYLIGKLADRWPAALIGGIGLAMTATAFSFYGACR
ncbi:uncharacterized protein LOC100899347 [Galendromus occidentalis]|uniref:Uncharacterized protein LOC100899347 n=1 Tax=Galendromus occidentalis TaxID=34638 RepID=A0AAJ6QNI0_9ACAR|nr:uncharacterized protein LOC100899347 [Galendromus occidentalis]